MCSLLRVTMWKICVNALQALVPWAVTSSSSQLPPSCKEVAANCTPQADLTERDAAGLWTGEMEEQHCNMC